VAASSYQVFFIFIILGGLLENVALAPVT